MKIILTETQIIRMRENLLLERVCPKNMVFDETLESCVVLQDLPEVQIMNFRNDPDGKIKDAYKKYESILFKLEGLYNLNNLELDKEFKWDSETQQPSVELFDELTDKLKSKYKEEYNNFETVRRKRFVDKEVRPMVGKPYVWGKAGPEFFDCSGLICAVFEKPRTTADGYFNTADIFTDISKVKVGDIVFFDYDPDNPKDKKPIDHVGIISQVDGNRIKMIHASGGSKCSFEKYKEGKLPAKCKVKEVRYSNYWRRNTKGFGRFVGFEY